MKVPLPKFYTFWFGSALFCLLPIFLSLFDQLREIPLDELP